MISEVILKHAYKIYYSVGVVTILTILAGFGLAYVVSQPHQDGSLAVGSTVEVAIENETVLGALTDESNQSESALLLQVSIVEGTISGTVVQIEITNSSTEKTVDFSAPLHVFIYDETLQKTFSLSYDERTTLQSGPLQPGEVRSGLLAFSEVDPNHKLRLVMQPVDDPVSMMVTL